MPSVSGLHYSLNIFFRFWTFAKSLLSCCRMPPASRYSKSPPIAQFPQITLLPPSTKSRLTNAKDKGPASSTLSPLSQIPYLIQSRREVFHNLLLILRWLLLISSGGDMVEGIRIFDSQGSSHERGISNLKGVAKSLECRPDT